MIFLEHRIAGGIAFLWSSVSVGITRVAQGFHYPSDIVAGLLFGIVCVVLSTRIRPRRDLFERLLLRFEPRIKFMHALLFLFLADAYNLFPGLQSVLRGSEKIGAYFVGRL